MREREGKPMPVYIGRALTALALMAISVYVWVASEEFPANGHQIPQFVSGVAVLLCLVLFVDAIRQRNSGELIKFDFSYQAKKQYLMLALAVIYIPAMFMIGYYVTTLALLVIGSLVVGIRNYKTIALTALITMPLLYAFFDVFLKAQLPRGLLY